MVVELRLVYPDNEKEHQTFLTKDFGISNPVKIKNKYLEAFDPDKID